MFQASVGWFENDEMVHSLNSKHVIVMPMQIVS